MYYKLTDRRGYTRRLREGETLWEVGKVVCPTGEGNKPCGPGVLHFYSDSLLAIFINPDHANIGNPRMFIVAPLGKVETDGLKCWTTGGLRVAEEIRCPELTSEQRVAIAIRTLLGMPGQETALRSWGEQWLEGNCRVIKIIRQAVLWIEPSGSGEIQLWRNVAQGAVQVLRLEGGGIDPWAEASAARQAAKAVGDALRLCGGEHDAETIVVRSLADALRVVCPLHVP